MKQKGYFGFGKIIILKKILSKEKAKNIFLVCGKQSFEKSGAKKSLEKFLDFKKDKLKIFNSFSPNPLFEEIELGLSEFKKKNFDIIVAIGGGSAIDTAKAIKLFYHRDTGKNIPLVAVPTTAGTGSESTYFIVYYKNHFKVSSGIKNITLPDYFICDPSLIYNLPKKIKSSSALDALGQAIESYWSINSTHKSKRLAEKAIRLIIKSIRKAVINNSLKSNQELMKAANLSGKAINITKTTVCHAISYPITSYFGVPHGHAVMITLPDILEYNFKVTKDSCNDVRGVHYIKKTLTEIISFLGSSNVSEAKNKLKKLMKDLNLESDLKKLNLSRENLEKVLNGINIERLRNNPRRLSYEDLNLILKKVL
jgi:alcohol dehydrogenase